MKQRNEPQRNRLLRAAQCALAGAALAVVAACGGGGGGGGSTATTAASTKMQVVSFGDSLSDVGTYAAYVLPHFGGGRFTTNPGEVWTQKVAESFGDTLTPAYQGGFGSALQATGGFGYAQGGARVTDPQGIGWAPNDLAATTTPIVTQVSNYLSAHGSFNSNQIVLIQGGANDIFANSTALVTAIETDMAAGLTAQAAILKEVSTTLGPVAKSLVDQVGTIVANGATHVVLANVPDIGQTPLGVQTAAQQGAAAQQLLSGIAQTFNGLVASFLQAENLSSKVIFIDSFTWQDTTLANFQANGFSVSNTGTACNLQQMQASATSYAEANPSVLLPGQTAAQFGAALASSLFCSPQTQTVAGADQSYMFADMVHPTTHLHALFAQYVEQQLAAAGVKP
ncbi:phospholipase/lecithinase/hemolysin [Trinickia symbiotica]|uniref:Acylhydrolase n=1 Tax=Trinickia symbiotica TaxID=863227 RepID=A0A2N7WU86_9BURK|nr:SGNH/GDSL hydrolase family protein [Trinickia symbiotica]PMS32825.1 acylhydrolase [Trinickia symbiotica]PPK42106.1 phospholipase/lecithinase/hemolysin [Trinickia symbiotica]